MMIYLILFILSSLLAFIILALFNWIPLSWFCDYGESVQAIHHRKIVITHWLLPVAIFLTATSYALFNQYSLVIAIPLLAATCVLCQIVFSDILYRIVPDQHIVLLFILGIPFIFLDFPHGLYTQLISGLIGGSLYLLVVIIGNLFNTQDAIGFGDIKLMAALGFLTNVTEILSIFVLATLFSTIFLLFGLLFRKIKLRTTFALAPFISLAFILLSAI